MCFPLQQQRQPRPPDDNQPRWVDVALLLCLFPLFPRATPRLLIPMQFVSSSPLAPWFNSRIPASGMILLPLSSTPTGSFFSLPHLCAAFSWLCIWQGDTHDVADYSRAKFSQIPQWIQMLRSVLVSWENVKIMVNGEVAFVNGMKWREDCSWRKASLGKWSGFVSPVITHL